MRSSNFPKKQPIFFCSSNEGTVNLYFKASFIFKVLFLPAPLGDDSPRYSLNFKSVIAYSKYLGSKPSWKRNCGNLCDTSALLSSSFVMATACSHANTILNINASAITFDKFASVICFPAST